jgi:hypothetical protein
MLERLKTELKPYIITTYFNYTHFFYPFLLAFTITIFLESKSRIVTEGLSQSHYQWGLASSMFFLFIHLASYMIFEFASFNKNFAQFTNMVASFSLWLTSQSLALALAVIGLFAGHYSSYNLFYLNNNFAIYLGIIIAVLFPVFLTSLGNGLVSEVRKLDAFHGDDKEAKSKKIIKKVILLSVIFTIGLGFLLFFISPYAVEVFLGNTPNFF